jgi:hypothetical protein
LIGGSPAVLRLRQQADRLEQVERHVMVVALQSARSGQTTDWLFPALDTGGAVTPARVELIELDDIRLHENCDFRRVHVLAKAIATDGLQRHPIILALQLRVLTDSESIGNHDSKIVGACGVD